MVIGIIPLCGEQYLYASKIDRSLCLLLMIAYMEPFHDRTMEPLGDRGYGATS